MRWSARVVNDESGRVWPQLLGISVLCFPMVITSAVCLLMGLLTGSQALTDSSITLLPLTSVVGAVPLAFGVVAGTRLLRRDSVPRWARRVAVLVIVLGVVVQAGCLVALMTAGLVELP